MSGILRRMPIAVLSLRTAGFCRDAAPFGVRVVPALWTWVADRRRVESMECDRMGEAYVVDTEVAAP